MPGYTFIVKPGKLVGGQRVTVQKVNGSNVSVCRRGLSTEGTVA